MTPGTPCEPNFPFSARYVQRTADGIPTYWFDGEQIENVLAYLKNEVERPYPMLYDLFCIDERERSMRQEQPACDFTVVYQLYSFDRNSYVRLKIPLHGEEPRTPSVTSVWPAADWYEREAWDMFGVRFDGHPGLRRILMPKNWQGHPLRKEHPARATELPLFPTDKETLRQADEELMFRPEELGLGGKTGNVRPLFLNIGPQHPGTHGPFRVIAELEGEKIVDAVPDIGFHHRAAEKMGERQSWHTYIPYTDRVDYLGGVLNEMPYVLSVEKLAGIDIPPRAQVIRVMLSELCRLSSHLVWYGTFAQDLGALSPVFFTFNDRERIFTIIGAITGARMHPGWFRIGGVAADLPEGWEELLRDFLRYIPARLDEFDKMVLENRIFKRRTLGVGAYSLQEAIEWGVTGPGLRACGLKWDFRKMQPYSGYENFDFDVPTAQGGDSFARAVVRVQEMRQSVRIVRQCLENMPAGPYKSSHPLSTPPLKDRTMQDIETLIHHFLSVSWGPVIPPGEAVVPTEAAKGNNGYYLISDGNTFSYRTRIRTPSFAHMQMLPLIARGSLVADLMSILGSMDYVMGDVDR